MWAGKWVTKQSMPHPQRTESDDVTCCDRPHTETST